MMLDDEKDTLSEGLPAPQLQPKTGRRVHVPVSGLALVIVVALGSFVAGSQYQKSHSSTIAALGTAGGSLQTSAMGQGGGQMGSFGTVTAVTSSSISVQDQRTSSTKTYTVVSSTSVTNNGAASSLSAIATGDSVLVQTESSSSTTATQIILNPIMQGGPGGTGATPSASSSASTSVH